MALYRNIGSVSANDYQGDSVGLTLVQQPAGTLSLLTPTQIQASTDTYWQQQNDRYNHAMSVSLDALHTEGIFVTTDNGSLFISPTPPYTGGVPDFSRAWLPIQDIQEIENQRGTAGALLLHLQQPALAKDTAGHDSGSSTTWSGSTGTASTPIPEVQSLPPVTTTPDGTVAFQNGSTPTTSTESPLPTPATTTTTTTTIPTTTTTTTVTPVPATAGSTDWVSVLTLAGAMAIAVTGDRLIHHRSKLFFAGGIGLLYYLLSRPRPITT